MATIQGYRGAVTIATEDVGSASAWSLDMQASDTDTTTFADAGWSSSCAGLKSWSGSITCSFTAGEDIGEAAIIAAFESGTPVALELITGAAPTTPTAGMYSGEAVITGFPITNEVSGCVIVTFAFKGNGALTIAPNVAP